MIRAEENDVKLDGVSMFIPNQGGDMKNDVEF